MFAFTGCFKLNVGSAYRSATCDLFFYFFVMLEETVWMPDMKSMCLCDY